MSGCRCGRGAVAALALRGLVGHCCPGIAVLRAWCRCRPGALALQDFGGCCCPGIAVLRALAAPLLPRRPVVADVDGSDADRGEAEPFTAKRSGTG